MDETTRTCSLSIQSTDDTSILLVIGAVNDDDDDGTTYASTSDFITSGSTLVSEESSRHETWLGAMLSVGSEH